MSLSHKPTLAVPHRFEQAPAVAGTAVCICGAWPEHHIHTGVEATCTCTPCLTKRGVKRPTS